MSTNFLEIKSAYLRSKIIFLDICVYSKYYNEEIDQFKVRSQCTYTNRFIYKIRKMNRISFLGKEFVHGGHLFALGNSAIVLTILLLLNLPPNIVILVIPYLITQIIYSYNHFRELNADTLTNPERTRHIMQQAFLVKFSFLVYSLVLSILLFFTNSLTLFLVISIIVGGLSYTEYFKYLLSRKFIGLKNFYTAFFWSMLIFIVPSFYNIQITGFFLYFFSYVFIRGIAGMAFSDVKDIQSDSERNLKTFAVIFGKNQTIVILYLFNILSLVPLILAVSSNNAPKSALSLAFSSIYSIIYLTRALFLDGKALRRLTYVFVDGEYTFWPILIMIFGSII